MPQRKRPLLPPTASAPFVAPGRAAELNTLHYKYLDEIEAGQKLVVAVPSEYPDGYYVPPHRHTRAQLLYAATGVVMVSTDEGRWMVPPAHALWIPPATAHSVEMQGQVMMNSVYVMPDTVASCPEHVRVVGLTPLMRSLIAEAMAQPKDAAPNARDELIMALMLAEIPNLPAKPLGLPFPAEPRLARLCRAFVASPDPHLTIDDWAAALAMSRRAFTRAFRRATGLSLSTWRQQACLFTAVPRW